MLFNPFNSTTMRQQQPRRIHIRRMPLSRDIIHPDFTHQVQLLTFCPQSSNSKIQKRTQSGQEELPQQTPTTEPVEQYKDLPQSFLVSWFCWFHTGWKCTIADPCLRILGRSVAAQSGTRQHEFPRGSIESLDKEPLHRGTAIRVCCRGGSIDG